MVFFENVHVFNCRSETRLMLSQPRSANPLVVLTVIATLALHLFAIWTSGFGVILHVVAPDPVLVVVAIPLALGLAPLFEGYKWLVRRCRRPAPAALAGGRCPGSVVRANGALSARAGPGRRWIPALAAGAPRR